MGANERSASAAIADQPAADTGRPAGQPGWLSRARLAWIGAYLGAGIVLFLCYLRVSGTQSISSDGGSNALEAWDMLHGNLLLHGWTVTDVSFYTTELPEYMILELIRGMSPALVHTAAAFTYTVLVLLAGLVAKGRATGREGVVRALLGSGIMLAPQLGTPTFILLLVPDHVGTGIPMLLIFLVLDRAPRRWYVPPVIAVMLTWALVADRLVIAAALVPLLLVCAVRVYRAVVRARQAAGGAVVRGVLVRRRASWPWASRCSSGGSSSASAGSRCSGWPRTWPRCPRCRTRSG